MKFIDGYDLTCDNCNHSLEQHGGYSGCNRFLLSADAVTSLVAHINTLAEFIEAKFPEFNGGRDAE